MEFLLDYWLYILAGGAFVFGRLHGRSSDGRSGGGWFGDCDGDGGDGGD